MIHTDSKKVQLVAKANWCRLAQCSCPLVEEAGGGREHGRTRSFLCRPDGPNVDARVWDAPLAACVAPTWAQMVLDKVFFPATNSRCGVVVLILVSYPRRESSLSCGVCAPCCGAGRQSNGLCES